MLHAAVAQTPIEHLDVAEVLARARRECDDFMGGMQVVLLMDAVQTPPVGSSASMLWEARFFRQAEALGLLHVYALETIYRTDRPELLELAAALRAEDCARAWPLVLSAMYEDAGRDFVDIVHDNAEIYPLAADKYDVPGAVLVEARSEFGGPPGKPSEWPADAQRMLREETKLLVEVRQRRAAVEDAKLGLELSLDKGKGSNGFRHAP